MSAETRESLRDAIAANIQVVVASSHVIDLTNQADDDSSVDTDVLNAISKSGAATVQRALGHTVDGDDYDAVDLGTRVALYRAVADFSATMTEEGASYISGVLADLRQEAKARRQGVVDVALSEEDLENLDRRFPDVDQWDADAEV